MMNLLLINIGLFLVAGLSAASESKRDLKWGELNFVHTTDTHGWLPGHLLEPEFSADWGDYISFIDHIRRQSDEKGVDVLIVDTGDRHDGNGLSDATNPGGAISQQIFKQADLDLLTIGNHELYKGEIARQELEVLSDHYGERYLTSNVELYFDDKETWASIGNRYRIFETKNQNLKIMAFGFLFNFNGYDKQWTKVTRVEDVVNESWFREALEKFGADIDVFVIAGHIPVRHSPEFEIIVKAIREYCPNTPIQGLGGHTHIRDFVVIDDSATALESGKFLETVGWGSISNVSSGKPSFSRSYIDFNIESLTYHTNTNKDFNFHTPQGESVSSAMEEYRQFLNLTEHLGCVPQTYYTNRSPYPSRNSIFSLLEETILPMVESDDDDTSSSRFILFNTGGIRYDLVKGPFTKDTGFIVSPFPTSWAYIPSMPIKEARKILPMLNRREKVLSFPNYLELDLTELGLPPELSMTVEEEEKEFSAHRDDSDQMPFFISTSLSKGYVTHDDLGSTGDDTPHKPWPFYPIPNVIQSTQISSDVDDITVDLVFNTFMTPFIKSALRDLDLNDWNDKINPYGGKSIIDLLPIYFTDEKCQ